MLLPNDVTAAPNANPLGSRDTRLGIGSENAACNESNLNPVGATADARISGAPNATMDRSHRRSKLQRGLPYGGIKLGLVG